MASTQNNPSSFTGTSVKYTQRDGAGLNWKLEVFTFRSYTKDNFEAAAMIDMIDAQ